MFSNDALATGAPQVLVFGKTPRMGDFVRVGFPGPAGEFLEEWVQQGLASAETKRALAWQQGYSSGSTHAFVFRPPRGARSREVLAGVIRPSVDAVGRRFPLLAYATALAAPEVSWPHVLPMALGDFFQAAATAIFDTDAVTNANEMRGALGTLAPPGLSQVEPSAREYHAWSTRSTLASVWSVVFGDANPYAAARAVHIIADALAPFRGEAMAATKLALRLPLGAGGVASALFWLDVVARLARTPMEVRTCFWSFDGTSGSALIQLGDTPASTLGELWAPDADSEYTCDLTVPVGPEAASSLHSLPPHVAEALQAPYVSVRDFLDRLPV